MLDLELACLHDNVRALTTEWLNLGTRCSEALNRQLVSMLYRRDSVLSVSYFSRIHFDRSGAVPRTQKRVTRPVRHVPAARRGNVV